jgi:3-oxoadipate enol-lactonase
MSWADLDGIGLHYELAGTGPSLVLLHELGGSLESFDGMMPTLIEHFRVLRFDQRGAGRSEKPRDAFSIEDQAADLVRLVGAVGLPPPYHLVGIAAGSAVAVAVARARPGLVAALGLCAPALAATAAQRAYLLDRSDLATRQGMRAVADSTLDRSYPEQLRGADGTYEAYRALFLANDPVAYAHANRALAEADAEGHLEQIDHPALVLAGRYDLLRPPEMVGEIAAALPGAEYAVVECGHLMAVQAPDELARRLIDFFQSSRLQRAP